MNENLLNYLWIGLGGFVGAIARYSSSKLFQYFNLTNLPYSTFTVNILGSLLLGFLSEYFLNQRILSSGLALFLTVGLCGGFTTFSTFSYENMMLIRDGQILIALAYIVSSVLLGILAFFIGISLARLL